MVHSVCSPVWGKRVSLPPLLLSAVLVVLMALLKPSVLLFLYIALCPLLYTCCRLTEKDLAHSRIPVFAITQIALQDCIPPALVLLARRGLAVFQLDFWHPSSSSAIVPLFFQLLNFLCTYPSAHLRSSPFSF